LQISFQIVQMKKYQPTVNMFLDKRVSKKSGKFPLKLNIYCKPHNKLYKTDIDLTSDEWLKLNSERLRDENLKSVRIKISALKAKATKILENMGPFSFKKFEEAFYENAIDLNSLKLSDLFDRYIDIQNKKGNVGTAISYRTSKNSILEFDKNISLYDLTPVFLQEYEDYMVKNKRSLSTIGIYLRQLRAIYNDAISRSLINKVDYPFGKNKYVIPVSSNTKKALTDNEIRTLLNYLPTKIEEVKALDFWVLSYLCNGMNFCDILQLRPENIEGRYLTFIRSKTKNTKKGTLQQIRVHITTRAVQILNKWKSSIPEPHYYFPFLKEEHTPIQKKYIIQGFIKTTNKHMETIRLRLNIKTKCNTYSCRHSFATRLKREEMSTEYISESLGHSNILTTSAYLAQFDDKTKVEYSKLLTDF